MIDFRNEETKIQFESIRDEEYFHVARECHRLKLTVTRLKQGLHHPEVPE
jgi:hypothetical protein